jgi:dTDP-4-amino-4,6-dideoxygalactose transaminase
MIPITRPSLPPFDEYVDLVRRVWDSRMLSNFGEFALQFESETAAYLEVPFALAVSSCDLGLIVTLSALELPGDAPCFVSDFTFNSTLNAAVWTGVSPVLVDVEASSYNMSPESLKAEMERFPQPGVVLATHVFGNPCNVEELTRLAAEHGSYLVFDAAHGYGSQHRGTKVGGFGDAEVFSFSGTKIVTSGEGGLVTTRHEWLAERVRYLRAYGFQGDYRSRYIGLNGKISELNAALGVLSARQIDDLLEKRTGIVRQYLAELDGLVTWQHVDPSDVSTFKDLSVGLGSRRADVESSLAAVDVQTKRYFVPLHTMSPYAEFSYSPKPVASAVHESSLCVPLYPDLGREDLDLIIDTIRASLRDPVSALPIDSSRVL